MMRVSLVFTLIVLFALCTSGRFAQGGDETAGKKELQRIKREMRDKKRELKRVDRKERPVLSELEKIDRGIHAGSAELADQQKRLHEAEASLREVELKNAGLNSQL